MTEEKLNMRERTPCMKTRLERVALCADIASHYVQDMRVMPASGVARVAWDAMDHIDALEAEAKSWKMASMEAELECKTLRPRIAELEAERNKLLHRATLAEEWRDSDRQRAIDAEAKLREAELSELSALGQASEAYTAQLDAEAKLARAITLLIERDGGAHDNDCKALRPDGQCNCGHDVVKAFLAGATAPNRNAPGPSD